MSDGYQWDGWPHRVDGWVHTFKPYVRCGQSIEDDQDAREVRSQRLEGYRQLAASEQPLFRD